MSLSRRALLASTLVAFCVAPAAPRADAQEQVASEARVPPAPATKPLATEPAVTIRPAFSLDAPAWLARAAPVRDPEPLAPFLAPPLSPPLSPQGGRRWGEGDAKSYWVPVIGIVGFDLALNIFNRNFVDKDGEDTYDSDLDSIRSNLEHGWVIDSDPFATNQIGHPYQGAIYHGFARSAGLDYWTALAYDFGASALWEVAGETDPPSLNDQITTSFGGSFLGEALFRMASLILEDHPNPGFWRETAAALVSPSMGFNRLAYGERFDGVYPSNDPPVFARAGIGVRRNAHVEDLGVLDDVDEAEAIADFTLDYGFPGESSYQYDRPFDLFHFAASANSGQNGLPDKMTARGLLVGSAYDWDTEWRGVWGLYGVYDYFTPEVFSVSSTALALGTTAQWSISEDVVLQSDLLAGAGYAAAGTLADVQEDRDYRAGFTPIAQIGLRLIFGTRVMLDISGREYHVTGTSSTGASGAEDILRGEAVLLWRVYEHHAIGLQFVASSRDSSLLDLSDTLQEVGALSLLYTYVSSKDLGAVRRP